MLFAYVMMYANLSEVAVVVHSSQLGPSPRDTIYARTWSMETSCPKRLNAKRFAVNVKAGGKVHRLAPIGTRRSDERRALCGWRAGRSVAKAMFCKSVAAGELCRTCFRGASARPTGADLEDDIIDEYK